MFLTFYGVENRSVTAANNSVNSNIKTDFPKSNDVMHNDVIMLKPLLHALWKNQKTIT